MDCIYILYNRPGLETGLKACSETCMVGNTEDMVRT